MSLDAQRGFVSRAFGYLMAARLLHMTEARSGAVDIPELHLIGIGFEMLLKDAMMQKGKAVEEVTSYGDRLGTMWETEEARDFRETCRAYAEDVWDDIWPEEILFDPDDDPWERFQDEVIVLADLHLCKEGFPYPYVLSDAPATPTPAFLLATLQPIAANRAGSFAC